MQQKSQWNSRRVEPTHRLHNKNFNDLRIRVDRFGGKINQRQIDERNLDRFRPNLVRLGCLGSANSFLTSNWQWQMRLLWKSCCFFEVEQGPVETKRIVPDSIFLPRSQVPCLRWRYGNRSTLIMHTSLLAPRECTFRTRSQWCLSTWNNFASRPFTVLIAIELQSTTNNVFMPSNEFSSMANW